MKRTLFTGALITALLLAASEISLRATMHLEPDPPPSPDFAYQYIDIYQRLFGKEVLADGRLVYKTCRPGGREQFFVLPKPQDTMRVFVMGGSVAMNFGGYTGMQNALERLAAGRHVEIINAGMGAYDSYRESLVLKEIINYQPDLIILMSGNNEFFNPVKINVWAYRINRIMRRLWLYRVLQERLSQYVASRGAMSRPDEASFRKNLKAMISLTKRKGIPFVVCTLPVNFRDCPPQGSPALEEKFLAAWGLYEEDRFTEARKEFEEGLASNPHNAFLAYYTGKCYDASRDYGAAQRYYLMALELDGGSGNRCTPQRNQTIRRLCAQDGAILADIEKLFLERAEHGLLGRDYFNDNCHPWPEYNAFIAEGIIRSMQLSRRPKAFFDEKAELGSLFAVQPPSAERLKERSSLEVLYACSQIPHHNTERVVASAENAYALDQRVFEDLRALRQRTEQYFMDNWWIKQRQEDFDTIWGLFLVHVAEAFRRMGRSQDALRLFDQAEIALPGLGEPYLGRALIYYRYGKTEEARSQFELSKAKKCQTPLEHFYWALIMPQQ